MRELVIIALGLCICAVVLGKSTRTYYDETTMAAVREKIATHDWAKSHVDSVVQSAQWYTQKSDQQLWDLVPPPEQLRAINVCHAVGCPYCGDEIVKKGGHYPWILDRDDPYKVQCPVCKRKFPENDFEPWNTAGRNAEPESGRPITDKGVGWVDDEGHRYYFVPYFLYWQRWRRDIIGGMNTLGRAYLLTGDTIYAHKAAVMMCKVASEYKRFDYPEQVYHEGRFGVNGRISDRIWSTGDDSNIALAYDAIYPVFDEDNELIDFLSDHGIDNPRTTCEQEMLQVMADDVLRGYVAGNMGAHQTTMCHLAIVLDNEDPDRGHTTDEMVTWLMEGEGRVEDLMWNGFWRDGLGSESSPSYASGWCRKFYAIADLLPRLGVEIWDNPRLKKMADIGLDMTVAGEFTPCIGDCGSVQGARRVAWTPELQGPAFTHYGDVRYAKALAIMGASSRSLWDERFDEEKVQEVVEEHGSDLVLQTRDLGGYGLAVLESGGAANRRGVSMYYGDATGGHGHYDRLTLGFYAFGYPLFPEMGYPIPFTTPKRFGFTSNTISHYSVLINQQQHRTRQSGALNTLASAPTVQLMDASAEVAYGGLADLYRRTCALIDISDTRSYLLDIFRVRGGQEHHWSFHGPAFFSDFSVTGGTFGPVQEEGTLAGEDIEWAEKPDPVAYNNQQVLPLQKGEGVISDDRHYRERSAEGFAAYASDQVLVKVDGAKMTFTDVNVPPGTKRVFFEIYDYAENSNTINVQIGDVSATVELEPAGKRGFRWISTEIEVPKEAGGVTITADHVGQKYVQLRNVVISPETTVEAPTVVGTNTSGFEFLYDVQRMKPEGEWSATFTHPEDNVAVTMRMPDGCAEEVITALTEPPLQPGNPDTIRYVLGHNVREHNSDEPLFRNYIATVEPHHGDAQIQHVERMTSDGASPETVGLIVKRDGATDYIHNALSPDERCRWEGAPETLEAAAEFAMVTVDDRGVQRACVINGTLLRYGDFALRPSPSPAGQVLGVDPKANEIVIDMALPVPEACEGSAIMVSNDLHKESYMMREVSVEGDRTRISFGDTLFTVGMGAVTDVDTGAGRIIADRELTGYGKIEHGRHKGRWLYNEDGSKGYLIEAVSQNSFTLRVTGETLQKDFTDADGDGRNLYWICDFGPGDEYYIPGVTYYTR